VNNNPHQVMCIYLYTVFKGQLRHDPSAIVFQDTGIYWDNPELKHHSPDVSVILGVKEQIPGVREQKEWTSFGVAKEGVRPALLIEVTSPDTRSIDLVDKKDQYARAGVRLYVVVETDAKVGSRPVKLWGCRLSGSHYEETVPDPRGWLWLEPVGLWLGIEEGRVACFDVEGKRIGSYEEVLAAYEEVSAAYEAEQEARARAEARAATAEAQAAAAEAQAAAAGAQAVEERARVRELEEELRRLREKHLAG